MDDIKAKRKSKRQRLRKRLNAFDKKFADPATTISELEGLLQHAIEALDDLQIIDNELLSALIESGAKPEEIEACEDSADEYEQKVLIAKAQFKNRPGARAGPHSSIGDNDLKNLKLPKIEVRKFSGELLDWLPFWSQFSTIHDDPSIKKVHKFAYLLQSLTKGSKAYESVVKYTVTEENYDAVIDLLHNRYGRDDVLLTVYVRELLHQQMNNLKAKEKVPFETLWESSEAYVRNMKTLKLNSMTPDNWIYLILESNVPEEILMNWQLSPESKKDPAKEQPPTTRLEMFRKFVNQQIEARANVDLAKGTLVKKPEEKRVIAQTKEERFKSKVKKESKKDDLPTVMGLVSLDDPNLCGFCSKSHKTQNCRTCLRWTVEDRMKKLSENRRCYVCLQPGHQARRCSHQVSCQACGERHYNVICNQGTSQSSPKPARKSLNPGAPSFPGPRPQGGLFAQSVPSLNNQVSVQSGVQQQQMQSTLVNYSCIPEVLLPTVTIGVAGANGFLRKVRAAVDTMSAHSYIKTDLAKKLRLVPEGQVTYNHAIFGGRVEAIRHNSYTIHVSNSEGSYCGAVSVLDQQQITSGIPRVPTGDTLRELQAMGICLSNKDQTKEVEVLFGGDVAGTIFTGRIEQLKSGPTAFNTVFGWMVMGQPKQKVRENCIINSMINLQGPEMFWKLEAVGIMDNATKLSKAEEDEQALNYFRKTVTRKEDGRYEVSLPWIEGHPPLPSNQGQALQRLKSTTKKLITQSLIPEYTAVFQEWEESGIIEEVPVEEMSRKCHYLPHRAVVKMSSATTKVRPVFDASCKPKTTEGVPSLNDCLLAGPNLYEKIPDLIQRWRENEVAAIADIKKAFLQIEVAPGDRDYLRFLWWKGDQREEVKVYRHKRVVFGVNCSPFLLNAVLETHLKKSTTEKNQHVCKKLLSSLYVDNVAASFSSRQEYEDFKGESVRILSEAKFDLRLWESNVDQDMECEEANVLGVKWNKKLDTIYCDVDLSNYDIEKITKKVILSAIAKVYDPIGILSAWTLVPKILMQRCWEAKLDWDEDVPSDIAAEFREWVAESSLINYAMIDRKLGVPNEDSTVHVFCDASFKGYAVVVFVRHVINGKAIVKFVGSKSRVAPMEKLTINRLELIAAEIAARYAIAAKEAIGWNSLPFYFWTDSTTVRAWIRRNQDWGTFVGNRVRKVLSNTKAEDWKHVPGIENPADIPSRGESLRKLLEINWWKGPEWLSKHPSKWPNEEIEENEDEINREVKKISAVAVTVEPWYSPKKCRIGTYNGLVRVTAWVRRFLQNYLASRNSRIKKIVGDLSKEEIMKAELALIRDMQKDADIFTHSLPSKVIQDSWGIFRVETKLTYRDDEEDFKKPIIFPGKHYITSLLIRDVHQKKCHAGTQCLLAELRKKIWITGARRAIDKVIWQCFTCKRYKATHPEPETAPLPENRVRDAEPFEIVGVDYAGPLYLKDGSKVYLALYTCAVFRAIHLELVSSLSTEAFLASFRRFVARRGRPAVIYSDNGTNFRGAHRLLRDVNFEKIKEEDDMNPIQWIFLPPSAPWWGGWWERLVRTVKDLIVRVVGKRVLEEDELRTILADIESVINSRPLTYVHEGDDLVPLTPALFIHGVRESGLPEVDQLDAEGFRKKYRLRQRLMEDLRSRFRREYLGQLVQRKQEKKTVLLNVGDVVMIGSDNIKRVLWPIGVVQEVKTSKDGVQRVALVKTKNGVLTRPVQRLYPMEVQQDDKQEELMEKAEDIIKTRSGRNVKKISRLVF